MADVVDGDIHRSHLVNHQAISNDDAPQIVARRLFSSFWVLAYKPRCGFR
jgi:hypothetical protein